MKMLKHTKFNYNFDEIVENKKCNYNFDDFFETNEM